MAGTLINLTDAGRAALVGPGGTGTVSREVVAVGIASAPFVHDNGLTALPNEVKRVATIAGENIAPDTIHVTIRDDSADQYVVYGLGLYLDNGVLLGTYCQATPIVEKSPVAIFLQAVDAQFKTIDAALLQFGDTTFTNPPATDTRQGVVELATNAETQTGTDSSRAVTPAGLASRTATETRTGIAEIATQAETDAGTDDARMVTPKKLAARTASEMRTGIAELATQAETDAGTDDTRIITPKKLATRIAALVGNAPPALDTLGELATAIGNDPDFVGTVSAALLLKAPLASPAFSGNPTAPTAPAGDSTTKIATTAFVQQEISGGLATTAPPMDGVAAVGAAAKSAREDHRHPTDSTRAPLASPALTGTPTAPTAQTGTNTTQLATTAFVQAAANGMLSKSVAGGATVTLTAAEAGYASLKFTGALTANIDVIVPATQSRWTIWNATTGAYTLRVKTAAGSGVYVTQGTTWQLLCDGTNVVDANSDFKDIALTGVPTAPTAAVGTSSTQISTTAFVQAAIAALVNSSPAALDTLNELAVALGNDPNFATTMANALALKAPLASPALTGAPTAPTAAAGTSTTQVATTAFVQQEIAGDLATAAPLMNGVAAVGTSTKLARENHVHPTDTSRAPLESPALTGIPTAPTAAPGTNTTQISTTAFVQAAIAALVNSSPAALDTLNELATALGNDPNFATTMTDALAARALLAGNAGQVFSVANATANAHAVSRGYGDARYLMLSGGTVSGALVFSNGAYALNNVGYKVRTTGGVDHSVMYADALNNVVFGSAGLPTLITGSTVQTAGPVSLGGQASSAAQAVRYDQTYGLGQTLQNLTASRALGVTYTNTSGKPITIHVTASAAAAGSSLGFFTGGFEGCISTATAAGNGIGISAVVLPGGSYAVIQSGGATLQSWIEIR